MFAIEYASPITPTAAARSRSRLAPMWLKSDLTRFHVSRARQCSPRFGGATANTSTLRASKERTLRLRGAGSKSGWGTCFDTVQNQCARFLDVL